MDGWQPDFTLLDGYIQEKCLDLDPVLLQQRDALCYSSLSMKELCESLVWLGVLLRGEALCANDAFNNSDGIHCISISM